MFHLGQNLSGEQEESDLKIMVSIYTWKTRPSEGSPIGTQDWRQENVLVSPEGVGL